MILIRIVILGCGNIGSVAAADLADSRRTDEIVIADKSKTRVREVAKKVGGENVSWMEFDASKYDELVKVLEKFDLALGFLPGTLGYQLTEACIDAKTDLVDVSYMAKDSMLLDGAALEAGITVVPDCGFAPGISNILVGHAVKQLDNVKTIHIMVGGLPERRLPPLDYIVTWSTDSLIDEYTRKTTIIKKGEKVEVDSLSGLEEVDFPSVGKLEAFYTDGLRTLIHTMKNVEEMWEKTLRYKGHAKKIRLLNDLGFFDEDNIDIDGLQVSPRRFTARLLGKTLCKPKVRDLVAMEVEVCGFKNSEKTCHVYRLLDFYDKTRGITAMARTTAYPASIAGQLILKEALKTKGVVPTEKIGMDRKLFSQILKDLESHGVRISEETIKN